MSQSDLYPPIDPLQKGFLDVGEGHSLYWEVSGNPNGRPILFLHGGPGASVQPIFRRFFDPQIWKIVLFDQRGCGKSRPAASIIDNTTDHLIADIERLRIHLEIQAWSLFGGSWGSTLALAYGQAFPERVLGFTLRGIFLFRPSEVDWFLHGMGRFFPEAQAKFKTYLPVSERGDVLEAYSRRLNHSDSMVHLPAAHAWYAYEEACARLIPRSPVVRADDMSALAMSRIECHYMKNGGFLRPNQLIETMSRIGHLPCTIVQGRYDVICPPHTAVELAQLWPGSRLIITPDCGHSALEDGTRKALISAVNHSW